MDVVHLFYHVGLDPWSTSHYASFAKALNNIDGWLTSRILDKLSNMEKNTVKAIILECSCKSPADGAMHIRMATNV